MRRLGLVGVLAVLFGVGFGTALRAQAPAKPAATVPAAKDAAKLSDLEQAYVQIVALSQQLATCQSLQLDSVKQANTVYQDALQRIESAHPGFTVDWKTGALMAKPPAAPAK